MPGLTIQEIIDAIAGTLHPGSGGPRALKHPIFSHFHFDTRQITGEGTLFFALKSDNNDGHRYVPDLAHRPGIAAVVSQDYDAAGLALPLIRVQDPLKAAQQLAVYVRNRYSDMKFIGVTGSAGKTTTKEFIYQLLSYRFTAFRSFQNWNNWIGMPFSLLNMSGEEQAAVFELAMSEPGIGEIDLLAGILRPHVVTILNVYPVHLEYLKTLDNVAQAKSEILNHLTADDAAFINGDSEPLVKRLKQPGSRELYPHGRKFFFGKNPGNDIRLKDILRLRDQGVGQTAQTDHTAQTTMIIDFFGKESRFTTPFINRVHLENLFAALNVARHLGMTDEELQAAINKLTPLSNRGEITRRGALTIINETYNSNPEALKRTLDWVAKEYESKENRKRIAVLGDMLELGEGEAQFHREVGSFFASLGFDGLVVVGRRALSIAEGAQSAGFPAQDIQQFANAAETGKYLKKMVSQWEAAHTDVILLFKASRGIKLETALQELLS